MGRVLAGIADTPCAGRVELVEGSGGACPARDRLAQNSQHSACVRSASSHGCGWPHMFGIGSFLPVATWLLTKVGARRTSAREIHDFARETSEASAGIEPAMRVLQLCGPPSHGVSARPRPSPEHEIPRAVTPATMRDAPGRTQWSSVGSSTPGRRPAVRLYPAWNAAAEGG